MQFLRNESRNPRFNLALEEYLFNGLDEKNSGYALLWQNEPSIIVGRFQNTAGEINFHYVRRNGINVIRRITGGGAVYHDAGNLNYTFILPVSKGKGIDFSLYTQPLLRYLQKLGVPASFNSRNDLAIENRKFSGNAQHVRGKRLLHHGTILFDSDLEAISSALSVDPDKFATKAVKSIRSRVTNILPHIGKSMTALEFRDGLMEHIIEENPGTEIRDLTSREKEAVEKLVREKYSTWEWNWGSSPPFTVRKAGRFAGGKVEILLDVQKGTIRGCRIFGDFFSQGDPKEIETALCGTPCRAGAMRAILETLELERYFCGIASEDIIDLFCQDE